MKIANDNAAPINDAGAQAARQNKAPALSDGQMITGKVSADKQGVVSVTMPDGKELTAVLNGSVKPGETYHFSVSFDASGNIVLTPESAGALPKQGGLVDLADLATLLKQGINAEQGGAAVAAKPDFLADALVGAKLPINKLNTSLVQMLLDKTLPIDAKTLNQFSQLVKMFGQDGIDKALFFVENNIPASYVNKPAVSELLDGTFSLKGVIQDIVAELVKLPDDMVKRQALDAFVQHLTDSAIKTDTLQSIFSKQGFDFGQFVNEVMRESAPAFAKETGLSSLPPKTEAEITAFIKSFGGGFDELVNKLSSGILQNKPAFIESLVKSPGQFLRNFFSDDEMNMLGEKITGLKDAIKKSDAEIFAQALSRRFSLDFTKPGMVEKAIGERLAKFFDDVKSAGDSAKQVLSEAQMPAKQTEKPFNDLADVYHVQKQFKNVLYFPFLFHSKAGECEAELYVFKDRHKKKIGKDSASVLLSLNLAALGHFEVFLKKDYSDVNCQFKCEREDVSDLVRQNIMKLSDLLNEKKLRLTGYSFSEMQEPFKVTDDVDVLASLSADRRFSFDMRL